MIATDPLSLVFLGCIAFSGVFLVLATVLGLGHGAAHGGVHGVHGGHGAHGLHAAHVAHVAQPGPHAASEQAHAVPAHGAQASAGQASAPSAAPTPLATLWQGLSAALLSSLNVVGVLSFLLIFGLFGYLFHNASPVGIVLSLVLAVMFGLCAAVGMSQLLFRLFADTDLDPARARLEGRLATVSAAIHEGGIGEVLISREGSGRQSISARSADGVPIDVGEEVVVLDIVAGIANVQPWHRFVVSAQGAPSLGPLSAPLAEGHFQ